MTCLGMGLINFKGSLRFHCIGMPSSDASVLLFLYSYQSQFNKFIDLNFPEFTNVFFNNLDLRDGYLRISRYNPSFQLLPPSKKSQPKRIYNTTTPSHCLFSFTHQRFHSINISRLSRHLSLPTSSGY